MPETQTADGANTDPAPLGVKEQLAARIADCARAYQLADQWPGDPTEIERTQALQAGRSIAWAIYRPNFGNRAFEPLNDSSAVATACAAWSALSRDVVARAIADARREAAKLPAPEDEVRAARLIGEAIWRSLSGPANHPVAAQDADVAAHPPDTGSKVHPSKLRDADLLRRVGVAPDLEKEPGLPPGVLLMVRCEKGRHKGAALAYRRAPGAEPKAVWLPKRLVPLGKLVIEARKSARAEVPSCEIGAHLGLQGNDLHKAVSDFREALEALELAGLGHEREDYVIAHLPTGYCI